MSSLVNIVKDWRVWWGTDVFEGGVNVGKPRVGMISWAVWVGVLVGMVWSSRAAGAVACGDVLGPGGTYVLEADLVCDTVPGVDIALTVIDGARLDLGDHTVSGQMTGVLLAGHGAVLERGIVVGHGTEDVLVAGVGGHTVRDVKTLGGGEDGIVMVSDHNRVMGSQGLGFRFGLVVQGSHNLLDRNTGGGQAGFFVDGDENILRQNVSGTSLHNGMIVEGDGNRLTGNSVHQCEEGIIVSGQQNVIVGNTALENIIDLADTHEDCDNNQWAHNIFQTSRAGDTANPPCIQ
jgi:parallel beta-helix repeat protein